jgi:hypothetical protein
VNGEVHGGRPRPTEAVVPGKEKDIAEAKNLRWEEKSRDIVQGYEEMYVTDLRKI